MPVLSRYRRTSVAAATTPACAALEGSHGQLSGHCLRGCGRGRVATPGRAAAASGGTRAARNLYAVQRASYHSQRSVLSLRRLTLCKRQTVAHSGGRC